MRLLRTFAVCLLVVLVFVPPATAADGEVWGLDQIAEKLELLRERVATLARRAKLDPRELKLEQYEQLTKEELDARRREPSTEDLVNWVFAKDLHIEVRERIVKVLVANIYKDGELSSAQKGRQSPRARLSESEIVPKLTDRDEPLNRKLANDLLRGLWTENHPDPDARNYKWKSEPKRGAWKAARRAWKKYLDKR